mgnify:CR=1 FL=1
MKRIVSGMLVITLTLALLFNNEISSVLFSNSNEKEDELTTKLRPDIEEFFNSKGITDEELLTLSEDVVNDYNKRDIQDFNVGTDYESYDDTYITNDNSLFGSVNVNGFSVTKKGYVKKTMILTHKAGAKFNAIVVMRLTGTPVNRNLDIIGVDKTLGTIDDDSPATGTHRVTKYYYKNNKCKTSFVDRAIKFNDKKRALKNHQGYYNSRELVCAVDLWDDVFPKNYGDAFTQYKDETVTLNFTIIRSSKKTGHAFKTYLDYYHTKISYDIKELLSGGFGIITSGLGGDGVGAISNAFTFTNAVINRKVTVKSEGYVGLFKFSKLQ